MFAALSTEALAEKRVALVLGNSAYTKVTPLSNPRNDAASMAALFEKAGFSVVSRNDLTIEEMRKTMRDFTEASGDAEIAVIYYAGHGIEIDGINYLLPIDAKLARDIDVEDEAISMDRVMRTIEPARKLRLLILDACRGNPFTQSMKRTVASRSVGRGLAKVEPATSDTLVAFAAKAGSTAADGDGSNSPFSAALIKHITVPGLDLRIALGRVRDEVLSSTSRRQEPFVYGSLGGSVVSLVPQAEAAPEASQVAAPAAGDALRRDYELAVQVGTQQAFESFLDAYPTGFYANLAKSQLAKAVAARKAEAAAAEAKAKAEAAAAAASNGDTAMQKKAATDAQRAKAEADAKEKLAASAERARRRAAERASEQARQRERNPGAAAGGAASRVPRNAGGSPVLASVPPPGTVPYGKRLLINNGQCPAGQILEMIAGNPQMQTRRSLRCIPR
ncbi:MAG: caspase family protein [Bradyrhizobium sp.]|nr:caspase family protein [Bradyrhizobium sp.]MDP3075820.1 caspase family protein [Bradyrhizobium sp.]